MVMCNQLLPHLVHRLIIAASPGLPARLRQHYTLTYTTSKKDRKLQIDLDGYSNRYRPITSCSLIANSSVETGELPYWRLDSKRPYLLPSTKPYGPRSSRAEGHRQQIVLSRATITTGLLCTSGGLSAAAMTRWWSSSLGLRYSIDTHF